MKSEIIKQDLENIISEFKDEFTSLSGKRILITGGNGFIASYIVDAFSTLNNSLKKPSKLFVLNKNQINKESRLFHLIYDTNIKFISQDIGKSFKIPPNLNIIFHAASISSPTSFLKNPLDTFDANVNGTRNLLKYSIKNPVENFLFFSSADVYGNPDKIFIPTPESYTGNVDCINPRSCYSESKRISETLCSIFFREYGTPTKLLRIGPTYGPGIRKVRAIHEFFHKSKNHKIINLKDKGQAKMSFTYISDVISGIFNVMFKGSSGEAYNIASGYPSHSIKELAELIGEVQDNKTKVIPNNSNKEDKSKEYIRNLDVSKLKDLGFEPKISLREGLYKLKEHYDEIGL